MQNRGRRMMEWFCSQFIPGFCMVQFVCYDGTPNWLGWGLLGWGALVVVGVLSGALGALIDR
jgi:hypothetical protein